MEESDSPSSMTRSLHAVAESVSGLRTAATSPTALDPLPSRGNRDVSSESSRQLCFVIMPSGAHKEYSHGVIESDFVFSKIIEPAVKKALNDNVEVFRET